ncbi:hypothetical protein N1851_028366 [Merluccius polli]|uniref:Endonuclease/exonuclease/phosphatase domain-containing protein n=1 Tax=Merluccius polli TaxID=89951 RepID=A0AA47M8T8_MERPO|nr:hypothetical protein N1851_028366 [Merluccius polli]
MAVYIPPDSKAKEALHELYEAISKLQTTYPEGLFIIAGDFNHANLKSVLPKFYQQVDFPTRGPNILDLVYTNIKSTYKATPLPHFGLSDHITVQLTPAYKPLLRRAKPGSKQVRVWPETADAALQDCFECTDWFIFREAATDDDQCTDINEYAESVTAYINKCIEDLTVMKTITVCANQKTWFTSELHKLLKARDAAFKTGDVAELRTARNNLARGIKLAKQEHAHMRTHAILSLPYQTH